MFNLFTLAFAALDIIGISAAKDDIRNSSISIKMKCLHTLFHGAADMTAATQDSGAKALSWHDESRCSLTYRVGIGNND